MNHTDIDFEYKFLPDIFFKSLAIYVWFLSLYTQPGSFFYFKETVFLRNFIYNARGIRKIKSLNICDPKYQQFWAKPKRLSRPRSQKIHLKYLKSRQYWITTKTLSTLVKNRSMFQVNAQILEEIYRKKLIKLSTVISGQIHSEVIN